MANLIFTGHATRGKELHKLLENLGGVDAGYEKCNCVSCFYYINREGFIEGSNMIPNYMTHRMIMSLETFESKYTYKVGDKVIDMNNLHGTITAMSWDEDNCTVLYTFKGDEVGTSRCGYTATMLKPYKKEETKGKEISGAIIDRFIRLEGYDFYDDKGNVINTKEITMKKKKPQYPKTYEECRKIMGIESWNTLWGEDSTLYEEQTEHLIDALIRLKVCRDAYWKIAGEQMKLDKPWKPDWNNDEQGRYMIMVYENKLYKDMSIIGTNFILVFPSEEMRDAFYENFKELIESCKELL